MGGFKELVVSSFSFALKTFWVCSLASFFFVLVVITLRFGGSLKSSDVASWVQAIGSIGAIAGAYAVANWQIRKQRVQELLQQESRLNAMCAVVKCAAEHAESIGHFARLQHPDFAFRTFWTEGLSGSFEASLNALKALPVHELGNSNLVIQCMSLLGAMSKMEAIINHYMQLESAEHLDRVYEQIITQLAVVSYSWKRFTEFAGIDSSLQDYSVP
ncbi:hypothetical protein [Pseudomonas helleri]|uniref:hypothetical protein n=2 Tax=Pseudomonas helleri TaxID=1608996 RepID=UPI00334012E1